MGGQERMSNLLKNRTLSLAKEIYNARKSAAIDLLKFKNKFVERNCPICNSTNGKIKYIFGYDCKKCDHCGLDYVSFVPNAEHLRHFYNDQRVANMNKQLWQRDRTREFRQKLSLIESLNLSQKLIELGAGPGQFVKYLNNNGYSAIGYEIDVDACKIAKKNGVIVKSIDIESEKLVYDSGGGYLMYEIIEHIRNPRKTLINIYNALKTGGYLIITTPNAHGVDNVNIPPETDGRFLASALFPPYHINAFSVSSLYHLLLDIGFSIFDIKTPGQLDVELIDLHTDYFNDINFFSMDQKNKVFSIFQSIISSACGSGHMQVIAKKPG